MAKFPSVFPKTENHVNEDKIAAKLYLHDELVEVVSVDHENPFEEINEIRKRLGEGLQIHWLRPFKSELEKAA